MSLIILIIILVLLFGGGGGYYAHSRYGGGGSVGFSALFWLWSSYCGFWVASAALPGGRSSDGAPARRRRIVIARIRRAAADLSFASRRNHSDPGASPRRTRFERHSTPSRRRAHDILPGTTDLYRCADASRRRLDGRERPRARCGLSCVGLATVSLADGFCVVGVSVSGRRDSHHPEAATIFWPGIGSC